MYTKTKITVAALALAATTFGGASAVAASQGASDSARQAGNAASTETSESTKAAALSPFEDPRYAIVNFQGIFVGGRNSIASKALGTGRYEVTFDRDIHLCAYGATIGSVASGNEVEGFIDVAARSGKPDSVFVEVHDKAGALANRSFHLVVTC